LRRDYQLSPGKGEFERLCFAGAVDDDCYRRSGSAAQAVLDHLPEVASRGRFAIDMGDDVACLDAGEMGRPAGDHLLDDYSAVGPGRTVNADAAEIPGGICRRCRNCHKQHYQQVKNYPVCQGRHGNQFHGLNIDQRSAPVNSPGLHVMKSEARRMVSCETNENC